MLLPNLLLLSLVAAAPLQHNHHAHKREADADADPNPEGIAATVFVTNVVTVNQFRANNVQTENQAPTNIVLNENMAPQTENQAPTNVVLNENMVGQTADQQQTTAEPIQTTAEPIQATLDYTAPEPTPTTADATTADATIADYTADYTTDSTPTAESNSNTSSGAKGIAYSPYTNSGTCKSASEVASDMSLLTSYEIIRVYAPDCDAITNILSALQPHQKIFAGLFYLDSLSSDVSLLASQVTSSSRGWDAIYAVSVGNEWVNFGTYSVSTVVGAISTARSLLADQGYSGNVVTVDTAPAFQAHPELCQASDFVAANQHAFWNGNTAPEDSGAFIANTINELESLCGKDVLITETGWPSQGQTFGSLGVPGKSQQTACINSILQSVPDKVLLFTTFDDLWKHPGDYGVEQYWGLY